MSESKSTVQCIVISTNPTPAGKRTFAGQLKPVSAHEIGKLSELAATGIGLEIRNFSLYELKSIKNRNRTFQHQ